MGSVQQLLLIGVFFFVATLVAVGLFLFLARSVRAMKARDAGKDS